MTIMKVYLSLCEFCVANVRRRAYHVNFYIGWIILWKFNGALLQLRYFPGNEWVDEEFAFDILYLRQLYKYLTR